MASKDSASASSNDDAAEGESKSTTFRSKLPIEAKARSHFSFWEFMKNCIGKELTKITMPISFNEPLSFLQRVVEYLEYSELLFKAAQSDDPVKRLEYIAAFIVSGASSNWERLSKPFNPLQGETYELDRTHDRGFRVVCEQVSHHPPTSAFYAEAADGSWQFHGSVTPKIGFWGKTVDVTPKGWVTLEFPERDEVYTYQNVLCKVHNIFIGKLWVEHCGDVVITNHKTHHRCDLKWHVSSWFSSDYHRVTGYIYDGKGRKKKALYGKWVDSFYSVPLDSWRRAKRGGNRRREPAGSDDADDDADETEAAAGPASASGSGGGSVSSASQSDSNSVDADDDDDGNNGGCGGGGDNTDLRLPGQHCLWRQRPRPADSEKYFNFTAFAVALNDDASDAALMSRLPPTDARRRPDVRALENGDGQLAQAEKFRLEEKQRQALKLPGGIEARRLWFRPWRNPHVAAAAAASGGGGGGGASKDAGDWQFTGGYWSRDWSSCADVF